ncbi:MAG: GH92 family glycosyl hydrolase [Flavobacteriaceae bacterium]|nr:GH92 family glycosyl hydrolase [Flavobacteriaceae bacterium]
MRYFIILLLCTFTLSIKSQDIDFAQYVNPFIGTGGHGHTFPGATVPYGMVQLSPDTRIDGSWDGCSGYHFSDSYIYGFSHTHLNGTGVSDYGDILLMPGMGIPSFDPKQYGSNFQHKNEKAEAGYYSVVLDKNDIEVALTTSERVGFHQYTFHKDGNAFIILDLNHRDMLIEGEVIIKDSKTLLVKRRSKAWAQNQYIFAEIKFSVPMKLTEIRSDNPEYHLKNRNFQGKQLALAFTKDVKKSEIIKVKVALSMTGYAGAELNSGELKHWDFEKARQEAHLAWNKELSKIEVTSNDLNKLSIFYTALYHTMMQPNIASDLDGKYRGRDQMIHENSTFDYYTVFSLWDTFRATHPLYTLIDHKRTSDYINTFIKQHEQGGRLPVWELSSNETDCMIGYHAVSVIADAMAKNIKGFDYEKAFNASKHSAMLDHLGLNAFKNFGVIAIEDEHESVSKTLEYAYDDWCIAQMAQILNQREDYNYYIKRSQQWKNVFDWKTGFMRARKNGGWDSPFDPKEVNNNFTEGNSWQYSFFVPHDINGLIAMQGGATKMEAKLDALFNSDSKTTGRDQADLTGLIGQYAHGNEPSHHIAYLYNYVGKPEKTQLKVHEILNTFYKNAPDGLIGNEDCGQMSAWYVLSSMGLYNISPGKPTWDVTEPFFDYIKVNFEDGSHRIITKTTPKFELEKLGFENVKPNENIQNTIQYPYVISPVITSNSQSFEKETTVRIESIDAHNSIWYWISENEKLHEKIPILIYEKPIKIDTSCTVYSYTGIGIDNISNVTKASFVKKPNNFTIKLKSTYNPQYHAGGPEGLIDGINGNENWRKGSWQGYQNQDFEAVIDLQELVKVNSINSSYLQDTGSWILMPTQVEYFVSSDNIHFEKVASIDNKINPKEMDVKIQILKATLDGISARYVKIVAHNFGKLPEWHQGYPFQGDAFIFIDEITVE